MADNLLPMSTAAPESPPRKKRQIWRWLGVVALLLLVWFCWQLFGPNPPIIVSRETTYITEPLGPDGLPDYENYVLDKSREGVTPENNAALLLWQAVWPGELEASEYEAVCRELGLAETPPDSMFDEFDSDSNGKEVADWLKEKGIDADPWHLQYQVLDRPWGDDSFPPMAAWLKDNQQLLDTVVEATKRPRYYSPSPTLLDGKKDDLFDMHLPMSSRLRDLGQGLAARAMWNLNQSDSTAAWDDLLACHRLARLAAQGKTIEEQKSAIYISRLACEGTVTLLDYPELTQEQAVEIQRELEALPMLSALSVDVLHHERIGLLSSLAHQSYSERLDPRTTPVDENLTYVTYVDGRTGLYRFARLRTDWNTGLSFANHWFDRLDQSALEDNYVKRREKLLAVEDEFLQPEMDSRPRLLNPLTFVPLRPRSQAVTEIFASYVFPEVSRILELETRENTQLQIARLAAALAVYRTEHGGYPESLEVLVPDIVSKLPADLYHERPFFYRRDEDGYLLYSAGPNDRDERGNHEYWGGGILTGRSLSFIDDAETEKLRAQIPAGADDIAIRVPTPPFKLPEP